MRRRVVFTALALVIAIYMVGMILWAVPVHVDEAVQYHPLACSEYPNAQYHRLWNGCEGKSDLNLFGLTLPRAYPYIGALSSFLYWPFFTIYPAVVTQRLLGVVFLLGIVWAVRRLEPIDSLAVFVILGLSFPLVYQLVADTGPVRFGLWVVVLTPLLVRTISRLSGWRWALLNVLLGVLVFLAVEDKPFFLYFLPSLAALAMAYGPAPRELLAKTWLSLALFGGLAGLYLFVAQDTDGVTYFQNLVTARGNPQSMWTAAIALASYLTNFEKFTSMIYETRQFRSLNIGLTVLVWAMGLVVVGRAFRNYPEARHKLAWTTVAFALSLVVLIVMRNAWTGHHFIYSLLLALVVMSQAVSLTPARPFLVLCALTAIIVTSELPSLDAHGRWAARDVVFDYLRQEEIARRHVLVHASLGTYYVASLVRPRGSVVRPSQPV